MKKTDNHNLRAKLELRRHFLKLAKFNRPISVCDCFSGGEVIWGTLAKEFPVGEYLALDVKEKRGRLKLDSLRYLQNQAWTHDVIDLDAYGSPWRHWFEVCKRASALPPGPRLVFLTIGETMFKQQQKEALHALGVTFDIPPAIQGQLGEMAFQYCLSASAPHIVHAAEALNPGGTARYIGLEICR